MKKRILMILITLTVLSSMILCALLGVTKAEYFKILSNKVGFEAKPDLELEYYIYHADTINSPTYSSQRGTYRNSDSFIQRVTNGKNESYKVVHAAGGSEGYSGKGIVYQVKIPVNETGYYTLDFLTYMLLGHSDILPDTGKYDYLTFLSTEFYTTSYRYCVGCEVLTATDNFEFGVNKPLDMENRVFSDDTVKQKSEELLLYSDSSISKDSTIIKDSVYQWKTMSPYRAENVSLTFKAEQADVDKGYVIWAWDFTGLKDNWNHTLFVENLSVNKRMELDGTTKYRDNNTPYFMFPQTAYANNIINKDSETDGNNVGDKKGAGRNRWSAGRGTYVTEATDNSLGMRAELIWGGINKEDNNPISLYIPLKNVQRGATYKVTFDFSVARQGIDGINAKLVNGWNGYTNQSDANSPAKYQADWHSYNGAFAKIFNEGAWSETDSRMFQSYLVSGVTTNPKEVVKTSRNGHRDAQDIVQYANKYYTSYQSGEYTYGYPLTKYDEVLKYNKAYLGTGVNQFPNYTTSDNINDTYSKAYLNGTYDNTTIKPTENRNFFNAVQHTEYNGQYEINWITFYNTTFSFNIANDVDLDDLYWVWAIDALRYTAFYNLRIENVRIERVVEFASKLDANGVKIGDNQIDTTYMDNYGRGTGDEDMGPFNNYRGWNSTGQNYQARGHATTTYLPKGNIYAPIVDASRFTLTNDFTIKLSGKAVLKGGVDRYVYSIDGGRTWADMEFSGGKASADQLTDAEAGIDLSVKGQTPTDGGADMIKFNSGDAYNASFDNFALSVDLNKYKHQANLDIIIAAVPNDHPDYRCEILRIVNFNQVRNYVSFPYDFVSDITVTNTVHYASGATTPLNAHRIDDGEGHYTHKMAQAEGVGFTQMRTVTLNDKTPTSTTAYTRTGAYSHAYEDVRAAWTGFAVKKTLGITGWAMVEGGVEKYVWSADGGKTWSDTSQGAIKRNLIDNDYKQVFYDGVPAYVNGTKNYDLALETNYMFEDTLNGLFTGNAEKYGSMLTADLSGHVGEVVDVIFAAKPNNSEVYVPIGRVDNVAVYGDPNLDIGEAGRGMGTFYTRMHEVRIDDQVYGSGIRMTLGYIPEKDPYFARMNWSKDIGIVETALTYLEPYHVNPVNARFFNQTVQEVNSGGKIEIEGFTVVEGGVKQYKYSLDGGETWTILYTSQPKNYSAMNNNDYKTQVQNAANAAGISLDGNNGNNVSYTHEDNATLVVNLPALPYGVEKNLLVVAESNINNGEKNADGTSKDEGFIYPVLHMKIRIKNEGVGYFLNDANGAQAGRYSGGDISQTFTAGANSTYKLTFPVAKEGVHTLSFNAALSGSGIITTSVLHEKTEKGGERYFASKEADKSKGGTVDKIAIKELTNASTAQDVDFYFNATAEDVKRGYVVLDFDLSKLTSGATLNISNLMFKYGVTSVKTLNSSSNTIKLKLPALEVGKHEFKFSSHASTQYAIIHKGLDQKTINGSTYTNYSSASMSVPKTTYTIGEPIHVNYDATGTRGAWIGITRTIQSGEASREVVVGRLGVDATAGEVTFKPYMDSCEANAKDFAGLPAGSYKIYFRDNNQNIYGDRADITDDNPETYRPEYNVTDPISITIIDPNKSLDTPNYNTFYYDNHVYNDFYKSYGFVTLNKTVFYPGEEIKFTNRKYLANDAVRVVLCKANDNTILDWTWQTEFNNSSFASPGDDFEIPSDAAPGQYQVMFLYDRHLNQYPNAGLSDININRVRKANTFYGVIDITVLPNEDVTKSTYGITEITYGTNPKGESTELYNDFAVIPNSTERRSIYSLYVEDLTVNITQDDVTKGYIEVEYTFENLPNENIVYTTDWVYDRDYGYPDELYTREGDYLYFGWYPQTLLPKDKEATIIDDKSTINALGFYKGTDNNYYAKVTADPYGSGYKFDDGTTTVTKGSVYYFKVKPIKWRIVSENDVEMTVLCESIIDSMAYGHTNNYEESAVREWLAKEFYETAFTEKQRALIHSMTVDNSASSTGFDVNTNICADTEDMIYLPSYSNVKYYSSTVVRTKNVSDFAMATGTYANSQGKGNWMLRSPMNTSRDHVRAFDTIGSVITNGLNIAEESNGIVPMLTLYYKSGDGKVPGDMTYVVPPNEFGGVTGGDSYGVTQESVITSDFPITKGPIGLKKSTHSGAEISVPKVYYEYGEDIPIKYKTPSSGTYRVYITMDEKASNGRYGTWVIKTHDVKDKSGVIKLSDMNTEYLTSHVVPNDTSYWDTLPPGEYKIWLYQVPDNGNKFGTSYNQYHADSGFVTESLSIKILPRGEANPDFSMTHYSEWEYFGSRNDDNGENWSALTIDNTVYRQGDNIYFNIDGSWEHKWICVVPANEFGNVNITTGNINGTTARYAQWGHRDYISLGNNFMRTDGLAPGQYKVVYLFGHSIQDAWGRGDFGSTTVHAGTSQRIMTVIDITIIAKDSTTQTVTVNYTKGDGTPAETTIAHPLEFFKPITFHTVLDSVKPGTQITFTTKINGYDKKCKLIRNKVSAINYQDADDEKPYIRQGKYVYFGEYPQSLKADFVTIYTEDGTDARGYYRGSDGFYYAYVNAKPQDSSGYTFVNGKPIENGSVYYFRVEPIRWRVVSEDQDQNMVLICESILQNNMFDVNTNTWRDSDIRGWLNKYFINKAFTNLQKSYILNTSIDGENDKLYLPSKDNVLDAEYEFDSDASAWDTYRQKLVTDYARATGAFADMTGDEGSGNGIWMLRTPVEDTTNFIWDVSPHGEVTDGGILVNNMAYGVVPMLKLSYSDDVEFYEEYITIEKEVGNKDIYRANYSALLNIKQDAVVRKSVYNGSYMSVPKTYFVEGEPIPVSYYYTNNYNYDDAEYAWICIASTGKDDSIKDTYIRYFQINRGDSNPPEGVDIRKATLASNDYATDLEALPAGEYKIWFIYGPAGSKYWWNYDDVGNYNNPYINKCAVTDPICIKVVDKDNPDYSLKYKAWCGDDVNGDDQMTAMYSHIMLERNTFVQGEPIKMKFNGRTQYMWAWLYDSEGKELTDTWTGAVKTIGDHSYHVKNEYGEYQFLTGWTGYYEMNNSKNLAPGKYKLYYAVYPSDPPGLEGVYNCGAIVTILDITILPKDVESAATLKLDVVYTNTSGQTVRQTINNNVLLNNLLNSHPGNYDLTDDDNKIEGTVELTDVMPNTKVQFIFLYKKGGEIKKPDDVIEIAVDEATNDIEYSTSSNFAVEHQAFSYVDALGNTHNDYEGSKLSLPSMYFEYGQPIEVSYSVKGNVYGSPRLIITTEMLSDGKKDNPVVPLKNFYVTIPIKYKILTKDSMGKIELNTDLHDHVNPYLQGDKNAYNGALPVGNYKVWLVDDDSNILGHSSSGPGFVMDPFKAAASRMLTEPVTIKVIDPEKPDFSIMSHTGTINDGQNQQANERNDNTRIGIDKTVFVQGERIYFHIQLDYSFRHIMLMKADKSITDVANEPTKGKYDMELYGKTWRYAVDGYTNGNDFLDTTGLEPGHYKLYYLMGENLQAAIRGDRFYHKDDPTLAANETYSKLLTVIDIIILPKDATQTLTVTYTKYDGTTATVTESFPMTGKALGTELHNGKLLTKYHSGIDFAKTITDAQLGTSFVFTVTTNFNAANDEEKKYFKDRFTYTVLKESVTILS